MFNLPTHSMASPRSPGRFLKLPLLQWILASCAVSISQGAPSTTTVESGQAGKGSGPNVIMVIFDDLNDWVGPTAGHPDVITPNFDRLAALGISFTNAHNQTPVCMSSRNSFFSGKQPFTLGSYNLQPYYRDLTAVDVGDSLPEHFAAHGYRTFASGKFFHGPTKGEFFTGLGVPAPQLPEGDPQRAEPPHPLNWPDWIWDWGPVDARDEDMPDYRRALEIAAYLRQDIAEPFFIGTNVYQPHVPMHVPRKYFEMYDPASVHLPDMSPRALAGLGPAGRAMALASTLRDPSHRALTGEKTMVTVPQVPAPGKTTGSVVTGAGGEPSGELSETLPPEERKAQGVEIGHPDNPRSVVQAYLANVTFADACLGVILDAWEDSPYRENTYIIAFSDNGFHLGEKQHWAKRTLWHESTRTPLLIAGPGIEPGSVSDRPVGLIDLYPTLIELLELPDKEGLEGLSFVPQIRDPDADRPVPVLTTWMPGNHSVRTTRWVYIEYADGEAELYDRLADHEETDNLIADPQYADVVTDLARWVPREHADFVRSPRN